MKKVIITNATVIPFYSTNPSAPAEIVRVAPKKEGYNTQMVTFRIETLIDDSPTKTAKLYETITVYAKNDEHVNTLQSTIRQGTLVEIEGKGGRFKGKPGQDGKDRYYDNIVASKVTPISNGVSGGGVPSNPGMDDDDLPF